MAYSLDDRFPRTPPSYRIFEPGSYQYELGKVKQNKAPFLSSAARITHAGNRIWTHSIYLANQSKKIPNCTTFLSKLGRFPYKALSKEDIEYIVCKCGMENQCDCTEEKEKTHEIISQSKLKQNIFKGPTPRSVRGGLSVPCRRDVGFEEQPDGTYKRMFKIENNLGPRFYDPDVVESTAFYRGCKWSHSSSSGTTRTQEKRPGPADYTLVKPPSPEENCIEKVREKKRKHSKQVRYIEMVQQRDILEQRPGPAYYNPKYPSSPELKYYGTKAVRFHNPIGTDSPGPASYSIRRELDIPKAPKFPCLAKLPEQAAFGVKAKRFKARIEEGPSPASYSLNVKQCNILKCSKAAFGSSSLRFKQAIIEDVEEMDLIDEEQCGLLIRPKMCPKPTWEFKSKTIRMPQLNKKPFEQSPADFPIKTFQVDRSLKLQKISPFCCSEGRFQPWYNWIPVNTTFRTPGPGNYNMGNCKSLTTSSKGPLFRAERFPLHRDQTPAPNEYNVKDGGIETVLATHNEKLKNNIANQHTFNWELPKKPMELSLLEQEDLVLEKAIAALEMDNRRIEPKSDVKYVPDTCECHISGEIKPKMLRCFMYKNPIPVYF